MDARVRPVFMTESQSKSLASSRKPLASSRKPLASLVPRRRARPPVSGFRTPSRARSTDLPQVRSGAVVLALRGPQLRPLRSPVVAPGEPPDGVAIRCNPCAFARRAEQDLHPDEQERCAAFSHGERQHTAAFSHPAMHCQPAMAIITPGR
jgi:hypothetical protein